MSFLSPLAASADNYWGTGDQSNQGGTMAYRGWAVAHGKKGQVFNTFVNLNGYHWSRHPRYSREEGIRRSVNLHSDKTVVSSWVDCKNSSTIWWIKGRTDGTWMYNSAITNPSDIWKAASVTGVAPSAPKIRKAIDYSVKRGGKLTLICSRPFDAPEERTSSEVQTKVEDENQAYSKTLPYAYFMQIDPVRIEGTFPGNPQPEPLPQQSAGNPEMFKNTEFSKLYNSLQKSNGNGQKITPDELKRLVEEAEAKDRAASFDLVPALNAGNKSMLQNGGVLDVNLYKMNATVSSTRLLKHHYKRTCHYKQTWNENSNSWNTRQLVRCDNWVKTKTDDTRKFNQDKFAMPQNIAYYQAMTKKCNVDDMSKYATVRKNAFGVADAYITPLLTPGKRTFGNPGHSDPALAKTGKLAFYTKECPTVCTPSSNPSHGASSHNLAIYNPSAKSDSSTSTTVTWGKNGWTGAYSNGVNGNSFEFFRDNEAHDITLPVSYPDNSMNTLKYDGKAALTTTVIRHSEGTPQPYTTDKSGGKLTASLKRTGGSGESWLFNSDKNARILFAPNMATRTAFTPNPSYHSSTASRVPGAWNILRLKSTWASDDNQPNVFNVKWEYALKGDAIRPGAAGFTVSGGNPSISNRATVMDTVPNTSFEGQCIASFDGTGAVESKKNPLDQAGGTGSGVPNPYDSTLNTDGKPSEFPAEKNGNLVVKFIRPISE